jgi:thiol-disulfide isomerase/thioredoxin
MAIGDVYAPDFPKQSIWLNMVRPLSLADLRGQVVLLDFWTYCCINCLHVLSDLKALEEEFRNQPFLVIGIHSAKFFNEQNVNNIQSAIERYEISHPVVVDNDHTIWESYAVSAWPSFVLIDAAGRLRGMVSGEGHRLELTAAIAGLLEEGQQAGILATKPISVTEKVTRQESTLSFPGKIALDALGKRLFIADSNHHRILIGHFHSPTAVHLLSVVGSGKRGRQDGSFAAASFSQPQGLCLVADFLYVCDTANHLLRRVDLAQEKVETLAASSELRSPWDLDYAEGYLYIAAAGSHQIWSYHLAEATLAPFAGSGVENLADGNLLAAHLAQPSGISIFEEKIYFVDSEASALRMIDLTTDEVQTLIGRGLFEFGYQDGPLAQALLQHPLGVFAAKKKVYVADTYNQALREVNLEKKEITTLIGQKKEAQVCLPADRTCEILPLFEPNDVKRRGDFLYLADTNNHLIRVFNWRQGTLSTVEISTAPFLTRPI